MKRIFTIVVAACFLFSMTGLAMGQGTGKKVEWDEKTTGKVTFDGTKHAVAGMRCNDCHTKIFKMQKSEHKMADMNAGKECGVCHNGKKAFAVTECAKCHKK